MEKREIQNKNSDTNKVGIQPIKMITNFFNKPKQIDTSDVSKVGIRHVEAIIKFQNQLQAFDEMVDKKSIKEKRIHSLSISPADEKLAEKKTANEKHELPCKLTTLFQQTINMATNPLRELPKEIQKLIMEYLTSDDIYQFCLVSKTWNIWMQNTWVVENKYKEGYMDSRKKI